MKINKWLVNVIIVIQLLFTSCTTIRITENSNYADSNFVYGNDIAATLFSSENVVVNEFTKTFKKRFKEHSDFVRYYDSLCAQKLRQDQLVGDIKIDSSVDFLNTDSMLITAEQHKKIDSLFVNTKANYLIKISNQEVSNSIQGTAFMPVYSGGLNGGMGMGMGGGQRESCVVKTHFQVYNTKTRIKVLDFVSVGQAGVVFLAFDNALVNAIKNSIDNAAIYLKTGKVKF